MHPLVDCVTVARNLVEAYRERIAEFDQVFR